MSIAHALLGALFAAVMAAAAAEIRLPDGPGVNLVYAKCRTCHDLQYVVDAKGLLPAQWRSVIASMHDYGLTSTAAEDSELVQYLTTFLGTKAPPAPAPPTSAAVDGRSIYEQNCATCHAPDGKGRVGAFPPLAGNPDLALDNGAFPIAVVLYGIEGPIDAGGRSYDAAMPSFAHLSDTEIAAAVNFLRTTFGTDAARAAPSATAANVGERRKHSMSAADVHAYRAHSGAK